MRRGLTLLEIAVALLALGVLALFVVEPFVKVLLASQEMGALENALSKAQEVLEGYRANPPAPTGGCSSPTALEGGLAYRVCSYSEGSLARYEVRVYRGSELLTALVTYHPQGSGPANPPPQLLEVVLNYDSNTLTLRFSEPVQVPVGAVELREQVEVCFRVVGFCFLPNSTTHSLLGLPASGASVTLTSSGNLLTDDCGWRCLWTVDRTYTVSVSSAIQDLGTPPQALVNPGSFTCEAPQGATEEVCQ
ncbi:hypothetical protein TTHN1_01637 [Thermus thermophilus]|uniref:Prepilin-type N-terminal cleavage/methylation domain-containing protein n=1 Tax=Thermus thermophilus TaxID=274 RepID=A0A3P4ATG5_THETH|nr:Ig-like domain-containing protein [Thermus thermophilus]VCU53849.1 hypothetical protein TTHN1_01637 [Thermus thermophilus]